MPPSMHFLTQAAPLPVCLAPHIESEIQPLILVESAARAATTANEKTTTSKAMVRFIVPSSGLGNSVPASIMLPNPMIRQGVGRFDFWRAVGLEPAACYFFWLSRIDRKS